MVYILPCLDSIIANEKILTLMNWVILGARSDIQLSLPSKSLFRCARSRQMRNFLLFTGRFETSAANARKFVICTSRVFFGFWILGRFTLLAKIDPNMYWIVARIYKVCCI